MKAIHDINKQLTLSDAPAPQLLDSHHIKIQVDATAVNRADLLQRQGHYPPPPGASPILGLECAGIVTEIGNDVTHLCVGDRVMALLDGGGYAEEAVVDAGCAVPVPAALTQLQAAALMETFVTAYLNLFVLGAAQPSSFVLIHGGGSGVGTAAIQLCKARGIRSIVTAGSESKCQQCRDLGADFAINYHTQNFEKEVLQITDGAGVVIVLDCVGAAYLSRNLTCLSLNGRLIIIGLQGGARSSDPLMLNTLLAKRQQIIGSTLRSRPAHEKAAFIRSLMSDFEYAFANASMAPIIYRELPLAQAEEAHRIMSASEHFGKIVLRVR